MGNSLRAYIELLEMIAFFAGYPMVFLVVEVLAGPAKANSFFFRLKKLLPVAYAFTGTLFVGLIIKKLVQGYQYSGILYLPENLLFTGWAILSLLCWFRFFRSRPILAFLHSLVFFFWVAKNILFYFIGNAEKEVLANSMKLYGASILLNILSLLLVFLFAFLAQRLYKGRPSISRR